MSRMLLIQTIASVGAAAGIVLVYVGLGNDAESAAAIGFGLFTVSMLVTPALRLVPRRIRGT